MLIAAHPPALHDLIYVDKPVAFDRDDSWITQRTGYAELTQIAKIGGLSLISRACPDRSPIHITYDYD
jgi:hypothetical protein